DLTGRKSLVRLVDPTTSSTVALLRLEELEDLKKRYAERDGYLVLRRDDALVSLRGEARRLLGSVLRDDPELPVRVEWVSGNVTTDATRAHHSS
ncbi:MAG TPA: hypothetical protein VF479_01815, partial [Pseudolysinimonas sp.]